MWTYQIWCDSEVYIGFTSRRPSVRFDEHLDNAYKGKKTRFYSKLRQTGITKTSIQKHKDELTALIAEIRMIEFFQPIALNMTTGGEGNTIKVKLVDSEIIVTPVSEKTKQQRRKWYASQRPQKRRSRRSKKRGRR